MKHRILAGLQRLLRRRPAEPEEIARARALIAAIDRGGLPLNPARLNQIGRDLGLDISSRTAPEQTVARIRAALARIDGK